MKESTSPASQHYEIVASLLAQIALIVLGEGSQGNDWHVAARRSHRD
jgi:hypothetical protein